MGARHSVVTPKPPRGAWVPGCPRSWSGAEDRSEPIEMGERGPEKPGREIPGSPGNRGAPPSSLRWGYPGVRISWGGVGCMGAEGPSTFGIAHLYLHGLQHAAHHAVHRVSLLGLDAQRVVRQSQR